MKTLLFVTSAVVACAVVSLAGEKSSPAGNGVLDGTRWKIQLVPDEAAAKSGAKEFADTLTFTDNKFDSAVLGAKGFKQVVYLGEKEEREAEFEAEQNSETEGVAMWLGEVRGDRILGRLQWKKKDGTNVAFNFTGTKG